jgi:hypothetical protein
MQVGADGDVEHPIGKAFVPHFEFQRRRVEQCSGF